MVLMFKAGKYKGGRTVRFSPAYATVWTGVVSDPVTPNTPTSRSYHRFSRMLPLIIRLSNVKYPIPTK